MYPPERRARGISYVLFGSVFGAILGPAVFGPLFSGRELDAAALTVPWLAAAGISLIALVVVLLRRGPTRSRSRRCCGGDEGPSPPAAPLREILRRPGVKPAMLAALASFGVMVSVMNLSGYVVVEHHHHHQSDVFPIIGAHVLGMYALVLVVGALIDRIGRPVALVAGLLVMAVSTIGLLWFDERARDRACCCSGSASAGTCRSWPRPRRWSTSPRVSERGRLIGFNDLLSALLGASLALLGGYALDSIGVAALAIGATVIVAAPVLWLRPRRAARLRVSLSTLCALPTALSRRLPVVTPPRAPRAHPDPSLGARPDRARWSSLVALGLLPSTAGKAVDDFSAPGTETQEAIDLLRGAHAGAGGRRLDARLQRRERQDLRSAAAGRDRGRAGEGEEARRRRRRSPTRSPRAAPCRRTAGSPRSTSATRTDPARSRRTTAWRCSTAAETAERDGVEVAARGVLIDLASEQEAPVGELVGVAIAIVLLTLLFRSVCGDGRDAVRRAARRDGRASCCWRSSGRAARTCRRSRR